MAKCILNTLCVLAITLVAAVGMGLSCTDSSPTDSSASSDTSQDALVIAEDGHPVGWTEETHGKKATPDYAVAFPQGEVKRLDITISASNWQAMLDDMTTTNGAFGSGATGGAGGQGNAPTAPTDMTSACQGLQEGDACTATFNNTTTQGTCTAIGNGSLICSSQMGPGGNGNLTPPTEMIDACAALQSGDACTYTMNGTISQGTCSATADGQLVCGWQASPGVPPDGQNGGGMTASPEMIAACAALQAGDACNVSVNGTTTGGTCTTTGEGQLACATQMGPGGNAGGLPDNGGGAIGNDDTNPVVVPCTLAFEGKSWWYVGIRFKGFSSLTSTWSSGSYKLPFRIDFDSFEDEHPEVKNQRFFGFEKLSLASNWSDPTYLREKVTHDIFRAAGVPAPHTVFYRLYIDHGDGPTYFGLYAMTEIPDNPMLASQFGDDSGNLYKPTSTWASFNQDDFDKQSNESAADWSDVQNAITALHADRSDAATWRAGLEATFDVDGFLRWLAVNTVIVNWDTYGQMAHNYYLYANPTNGGRLTWIPWDNNMALMAGMGGMGGGATGGSGGLSLGLTEVGESWPLIRYLMDDSVYHAAYVAHMKTFTEQVFVVSSIQARLQVEHDLIAPYVTGAEGEQSGYTILSNPEEFDTALTSLIQFVADRSAAATQFLESVK